MGPYSNMEAGRRYPYLELDEWVIVPDHLHAVVLVHCDPTDERGRGASPALVASKGEPPLPHPISGERLREGNCPAHPTGIHYDRFVPGGKLLVAFVVAQRSRPCVRAPPPSLTFPLVEFLHLRRVHQAAVTARWLETFHC
jgi:hypothetical protein